MATIRIEAREDEDTPPKSCKEHPQARRQGAFYEFSDSSEEELAFWNTLDKKEKEEMTDEAYERCFHEALHDFMQEEAEKGEAMREREKAELGGQTGTPPPPEHPPLTPPSGGPPIQD